MDTIEHHAQARTLLAYLADTATTTEAALGYEGVLLELDRLVEPGNLTPTTRWAGNSRCDAYLAVCDHLAALARTDAAQGFPAALCRAELDVVWRRERAG